MASVYPPVVQRLFTDSELARIEQARRPALLMHAPTRFVREAEVEEGIQKLLESLPHAAPEVLFADPTDSVPTFLGLPTRHLHMADPGDYDLVVIASLLAPAVFYAFFLESPLARLPLVAPPFHAKAHRLFIRDVLQSVAPPEGGGAVEVGCIESLEGGHLSTLALAECLPRGRVTSIDANPFSIRLARHYCRGHEKVLRFIHGDALRVLRTPPSMGEVHLFMEHVWSDNAQWFETLRDLFFHAERFLAPCCAMIFLSRDTWRQTPGSFQEFLSLKGFVLAGSLQETTLPRPRFLVAMRRDNE